MKNYSVLIDNIPYGDPTDIYQAWLDRTRLMAQLEEGCTYTIKVRKVN